jgi:hypothetical protein
MGGTSWLYLAGVPFETIGMREDLGTKSAPELTSGPLSAVPVVVGLWPVLLTGVYAISKRKDKIAQEEKQAALKAARQEARDEQAASLDKLREKLTQEKTAAINFEVKKALEEAAKKEEDPKETPDESVEKKTTGTGTPPSPENGQQED